MAVAPDFMAGFSDLADGSLMMFRDPAENEKRGGNAVLVQQFQDVFYFELYSGR
jgi:hypothetical protein